MLTCFTKFSINAEMVSETVNKTLETDRPKKLIDMETKDNNVYKGSPFTKDCKVWQVFY